jgi:hypothetical protein
MTMPFITQALRQHARSTRLTALFACLLLTGCPMKDADLPRFTKLEPFDPHRQTFECKHEAAVNPPITPKAEAIFQQALAETSFERWPEKRNYAKAAELYEQAMKLGHWKAQFNLAGAYLQGKGVPEDIDKAMLLTEDLMRKGVPAAWDNMGAYYMGGVGNVERNATVAFAFWQKAADMGSMAAQTFIGSKLMATHDEPPSFWGNIAVGTKMLQCALAQGSAQAAYELGGNLDADKEYARALVVLHEGVKLGSEKCANSLFASFDDGGALVSRMIDRSRSERYKALADALYTNPDLRFPNLDKVLPLPPARLPIWDGKKESLIKAAKAVVPTPPPLPKPAPSPASELTGKAHIPEGWMLPERPAIKLEPQYETTSAPEAGYWIARLMHHSEDRHVEWEAAQRPLYYAKNERFDSTRPGLLDSDGRIRFHYMGELVPTPAPDLSPLAFEHPLIARGIARYGDLPEPPLLCKGHTTCRQSGVWEGRVAADHVHAAGFNQWHRQAYVQEGQGFPDPQVLYLDIAPREVLWRWLAQANAGDPTGFVSISLDEPQVFAAVAVPASEAETTSEADAQLAAVADAATPSPNSPAPPQPAEQPSAKDKPGLLSRLWPPRG